MNDPQEHQKPEQDKTGSIRKIVIPIVVLGFILVTGWYQFSQMNRNVPPSGDKGSQIAANVTIGGSFSLIDHNGKQVTEKDYFGRFPLVFFGYTYCPDVCPTELSTVADALDILGDKAKDVQPIFISVDTGRDTPEALKQYVGNFHPQLIGLTGSADEIANTARKYRAFFAKVQEKGAAEDDYLMDHSALTYLMGPDGKFLTTFSYGTTPEKMAEGILKHL